MADRELILSEASRDMMPETLRASDYYAANDKFVQEEYKLKQEIAEYAKSLEPWEVELARLTAQGLGPTRIAKMIGKRRNTLEERVKNPAVERLVHYFVHLRIYQDGPNELLRQNMLWRIAVDNEDKDPKEAIKALSELNRMAQNKRGTGGFNIVINGVDLQKGPLDG